MRKKREKLKIRKIEKKLFEKSDCDDWNVFFWNDDQNDFSNNHSAIEKNTNRKKFNQKNIQQKLNKIETYEKKKNEKFFWT